MSKFIVSNKKPIFENFSGKWMFISNGMDQIEIFYPTLDNIEGMKNNGFNYVVKGFKNKLEFVKFRRLMKNLGVSSLKFVQSYIGNERTCEIIKYKLCGNEINPQSISLNPVLFEVLDKDDFEKLIHRECYYKQYKKYIKILQDELFELLSKGRIEKLELII